MNQFQKKISIISQFCCSELNKKLLPELRFVKRMINFISGLYNLNKNTITEYGKFYSRFCAINLVV